MATAAWPPKAPERLVVLLLSVAIGLTYAATVNIMLNGLGIVLSPPEKPGFLPRLNAGAFNLGAGLSFAVLYAVATVFTPADPRSASGYAAGMLACVVILGLALAASFLIPPPTRRHLSPSPLLALTPVPEADQTHGEAAATMRPTTRWSPHD